MATMLWTISALAGIVLGLHYKVFILVPSIALVGSVIAAAGIAADETFWRVVLSFFAVSVAMQMGYLVGAVMRWGFDAARTRKSSRGRRSAGGAVGRVV